MLTQSQNNARPEFDSVIQDICDYVFDYQVSCELAFDTARYCLLDSLGCAVLALRYPECTKLLGPLVPGTEVVHGARVIGTAYQLCPVTAAFNNGALIRWLDYNDTWLAAEWGHPSDNLGGILSVMDYLSQHRKAHAKAPFTVGDLLTAMIKAHEIQGILALENSFNRVGLDHVVLVKVASTAVITALLGGSRQEVLNAISNAWLDGQALRTYRHAPNTGSRKSWAAGDATARAVQLALLSLRGEMGYPSALTAEQWGFYDVSFKGQAFQFQRPYGSYVMENILFKISYPAEFHAQTAVEAALELHDTVKDKLDSIESIYLTTHESAIRIISKTGPLHNPADRDHCLQYMVAVALIYGELTADHYENDIAADPRINALREKMVVQENPEFSKDYLDPEKRSIANSVQIHFKNGEKTEQVTKEYPLGHRLRREEGYPALLEKFEKNMNSHFPAQRFDQVMTVFQDPEVLKNLAVDEWMNYFL